LTPILSGFIRDDPRRIRVIRVLLMRSLLQKPIPDPVYTVESRSK
jgi:hypothetical protein